MAEILTECVMCHGTGILWRAGIYGYTCGHCGGTGSVSIGNSVELDTALEKLDDVLDKCNDILDKCNDILEALSS